MSKDDFRDRLKSYSSSPDAGEWSKMEQLLDADKDDGRKGFLWWRFGAALLFLGVAAFVVLYNMTESRESGIESRDAVAEKEEVLEVKGEIREVRDIKQEEIAEVRTENRESGAENREVRGENVEIEKENIDFVDRGVVVEEIQYEEKIQEEIRVVEEVVEEVIEEVIEEVVEEVIMEEAEVVETIVENVVTKESTETENIEVEDVKDEEVIVVEEIKEVIELNQKEEEALADADIDVSNKKLGPWHLVSEVGIKYPLVDIQNPVPGALVPSQRFFPSYTAGIGFGKSFGKFSAELGVNGALYQFKLGEVVDQETILSWGAQNSYEEVVVENSEEQFVINKFATVSPYARAQYSIPLKNNYLFGLHALCALNSVIDLPDQYVSDKFSNDQNGESSVFDFTPLNNRPNGAVSGSRDRQRVSLNFDLGFSIEKILAKRGRLALDLGYTFATGQLEEGSYTAFRNSSFQSSGTYSISGKGPVARLRYYLHFGKNS